MKYANCWSNWEYKVAEKIICEAVDNYGQGMDCEECTSEAWRAYLEADRTYCDFSGCCSHKDYAAFRVIEALNQMRQKRNERFALESALSLDMRVEDSNESIGARFGRRYGDFTKHVALWDFVERLGSEKHKLVKQLSHQCSDIEIMEKYGLSRIGFYTILAELQVDFEEWLEI